MVDMDMFLFMKIYMYVMRSVMSLCSTKQCPSTWMFHVSVWLDKDRIMNCQTYFDVDAQYSSAASISHLNDNVSSSICAWVPWVYWLALSQHDRVATNIKDDQGIAHTCTDLSYSMQVEPLENSSMDLCSPGDDWWLLKPWKQKNTDHSTTDAECPGSH